MNLIVLVDKNQNILTAQTLLDFPSAQQLLQEKTNNGVVVFDEKSCSVKDTFPHTKQIFFDKTKTSKFPDFLSPSDNSLDFVSNFKDLFEKFSGLEKDRVFVFGDRFNSTLLPYVKNVFMVRFDCCEGSMPFPDLLNSQDFELLQGGEPYLYEGEQTRLSIFKNTAPAQYTPYTKQSKFIDK